MLSFPRQETFSNTGVLTDGRNYYDYEEFVYETGIIPSFYRSAAQQGVWAEHSKFWDKYFISYQWYKHKHHS